MKRKISEVEAEKKRVNLQDRQQRQVSQRTVMGILKKNQQQLSLMRRQDEDRRPRTRSSVILRQRRGTNQRERDREIPLEERVEVMRAKLQPVNDVMEKHFYDDQLDKWPKQPRLTCIAYRFDRKSGMLCYAAALFKLDKEDEIKNKFGNKKALKKELWKTASKRLERKPISVRITGTENTYELHKMIRGCLRKYGAYMKKEKQDHQMSMDLRLLENIDK